MAKARAQRPHYLLSARSLIMAFGLGFGGLYLLTSTPLVLAQPNPTMSAPTNSSPVVVPPTSSSNDNNSNSQSNDENNEIMNKFRAQVEQGTALFQAGKPRDAISIWEQVSRVVGDERGFRLLYNLGVAYENIGDDVKAADCYDRFLYQINRRRDKRGLPPFDLPTDIGRFEKEATEHLSGIQNRYSRIRVIVAKGHTGLFRIDGGDIQMAGKDIYVLPGPHQLILEAGTQSQEVKMIVAQKGQIVEVKLDSPAEQPRSENKPNEPPKKSPSHNPPFSAVWIGVSAGMTLASLAVPVLLRSGAQEQYDSLSSTPRKQRDNSIDDYEQKKQLAYASWAVPATLGAVTLGLTGWYFLDSRKAESQKAQTSFWLNQDGGGLVYEKSFR